MWRVTDDDGREQRSWSLSLSDLLGPFSRESGVDALPDLISSRTDTRDRRVDRLLGAVPTWLTRRENLEDLGELMRPVDQGVSETLHIASSENELDFFLAIDDEFVLTEKTGGSATLRFEYEPTESEDSTFDGLQGRRSTRLEFFAILGDSSLETEGSVPFKRRGRIRRAAAQVGYKSGYVLGRVVRRLFVRSGHRSTDPLWEKRRDRLQAQNKELCEAIPSLQRLPELDRSSLPPEGAFDELAVLVHGTASCGVRLAACLYPDLRSEAPPIIKLWPRILRFEHDTFMSCECNVNELVVRLEPYEKRVERLLLLAHSRGGLVAASAAHDLIRRGGFKRVGLQTFGSPFAGTPLVQAGQNITKTLEALVRTGSRVGAQALGADVAGWVAGYACGRLAAFPQGISDMEPGSSYVLSGLKRTFSPGTETIAWSAEFNATAVDADGFLNAFVMGAQRAVFDDRDPNQTPNDGVVPVHSAKHPQFITPDTLTNCDHSAYFSRRSTEIRNRIMSGVPHRP